MRKPTLMIAAGAAAALLIAAMVPGSAQAQGDPDFVIDLPDSVQQPPPDPKVIANEDVPEELVGESCVVTLIAANNDSVHEGNNLIVKTGDAQVVFENVESEAFQTTTAEGEVTMGATVAVEMDFGKDNISSGGLKLTFDCRDETTTTTTTTTTVPAEVESSTTVAPTTVPAQVLEASGTQSSGSAGASLTIAG